MAAAKPEPAVAATAVQLGIDLFAWQPRTAKYWQSKVCPYAQEVAETVQGLMDEHEDEETLLSQGECTEVHTFTQHEFNSLRADDVFQALSTEQRRGIVQWILDCCAEISCIASEAKCSAEVRAALGKQRRFAAYCLSANALQLHFRRSPVPPMIKSIIEEAWGASETGFQAKRARH